ncbi:MAG: nitrogenase component 1 [Methanomicrobiales archaeon]|nr:nitrogenase component 1 [Methanomicrobiales archaeon]
MKVLPQLCESSRMEGCTLLGALSITTGVTDSITIVHGPSGCAHHNFSLIHATLQEFGSDSLPRIIATDLCEEEIIFGGEGALEEVIREASLLTPSCIYVLSTCIVDTIGDDLQAICRKDWELPVICIPTSGFLGGGFEKGVANALITLARQVDTDESEKSGIAVIGEKNLEFEVEENFHEVSRLLALFGEKVTLRFARKCCVNDIRLLSTVRLNILRESRLSTVGEELMKRFGSPYISSFPIGLEGTLEFLCMVGEMLGMDVREPVRKEQAHQQEMLVGFSDLEGERIRLERSTLDQRFVREVVEAVGLIASESGVRVPIPIPPPVGTTGLKRMLHRWRRAIHAWMR